MRPEYIDRYIQNAKELARLKTEQEELRDKVLDDLSFNDYKDISVTESERTDYKEDLIYDWVCRTYPPDVTEAVTKKTLDWEGFVSMVHLGKIDFMAMPDYCDPKISIKSIQTARRGKKNDN